MNSDYQEMLEAVKSFVSVKLGASDRELSENTKIEEEFGIAGLDTIAFYENFFDEFHIVNPEDFNAIIYVTSENLELGRFIKSIFYKTEREKLRGKDATIGHLARVALMKRWFEE